MRGVRLFPVENYLIYYQVAEDGVVLIARVIHGMRDQAKAWRAQTE